MGDSGSTREPASVISLVFESSVAASPEVAWQWISSLEGVSRELRPFLRMSAPRGVRDLASAASRPGIPMFRSWIRLFGVVPVDYSDLTLVSLTPGVGFVEQSPMGSMRLWRHARRIDPLGTGCRITDELAFQPRAAGRLVAALVRQLFLHRHRMLRRHLGEPPVGSSSHSAGGDMAAP